MKYIVNIILFCLFYTACTNKEKKDQKDELPNAEVIKIDLGKEYKNRKFPNTNYSMTVQKLEENEKYPIGHIDKLLVDDKKIYILDKSKAKALFIYNRKGKFLHIINQTGGGPGEFTSPQDFDIDKKTGNIIIMDMNASKFIFYSPQGEYIKEFKYDFMAVHFTLDDENNILTDNGNIPSGESPCYLKKMDTDGNVRGSLFPVDPSTVGITFNPREPLQKFNQKMYFLPTLSNCIYVLEKETPKLIYEIDFGKYWPSKEFCERVKDMHPLKIRETMFDNNYVCFLNYIQTNDILHLDFYKEKRYSFYYNKKTKQSLLLAMEDENISFPLTTYKDEFVFVNYSKITGDPILVFYTVDFNLQ